MADSQDKYDDAAFEYSVEHSVGTNPQAVAVLNPAEGLCGRGVRIRPESIDGSPDAHLLLPRQLAELSGRTLGELDGVQVSEGEFVFQVLPANAAVLGVVAERFPHLVDVYTRLEFF